MTPFQYIRQTQGAVAILFCLLVTPITVLLSASIDFSNISYVQTQLAYAADAAAIATARYNLKDSPALASKIYYANYSGNTSKKGSNLSINVSSDQKKITVNASQTVTPLIGIINDGNINAVSVTSVTERIAVNYELAMVLDVTGSMAENGKIAGLISASNNVVTILSNGLTTIPNGLVSIVPFVACVNVGSTNTKWVDTNPTTVFPVSAPWQGCVMARTNNLNDGENPPSAGLWPLYYTSSTYQQYGTQKGDNDWTLSNKGVVVVQNAISGMAIGPNRSCGPSLVPLTNNATTLRAKINSLAPIGGGGTIGSEGIAWGWYTISPLWRGSWNVTAGYPMNYNLETNQKMMIIVTDGTNQWYDTPNYAPVGDPTAYGRVWQNLLGTTDLDQTRDIIDNKVLNLCQQIKNKGITIYTILLMVDDARAQQVYQQCASEPAYAFLANTVTTLYDQLSVIASATQKVRIIK
ncbi:MAG: pilus assembly protein TadG-related protein [Janthinobacterium lividum]